MKYFWIPLLTVMSINLASAGEITIETKDSIIRNDVFDEKRERADEYKRLEQERDIRNQNWFYTLPVGCGLYRHHASIYRCGSGQFYKGVDDVNAGIKYRQLDQEESSQLEQSNSK